MRVRLPKPLHGWRAFVGEVGVIVLGVLIALAAQQAAEWIRDKSDVDDLRRALRAELADDRARWEGIRASDQCMAQRLDALDRWLVTASAGARLDDAYAAFLWNLHSSAWETAKASPASQLLGLDERLTYASLYDAIDNWRGINAEEGRNSEAINALFANANQPENRRQLPQLLTRARLFLKYRKLNYPYFFTRFDTLKIAPDRSKLTLNVDPNELCKPLRTRR
jgi:hypothetical protein